MMESIKKNEVLVYLKWYFEFIKLNYKKVIIFSFFGCIIGFTYAFIAKPYYHSKLVFLINDSKQSNINPLSALVGQLGINQIGPGITEDRIIYLASSKRILAGALLHSFNNENTIADTMIGIWDLKNVIAQDTFLNDFSKFKAKSVEDLDIKENKVIDLLINHLLLSKKLSVEAYKKKVSSLVGSPNSGILIINFECKNELASLCFTKSIYDELSEFYTNSVLKSLSYNYQLISRREDSIRFVLADLENETALALDQGFNVFKFKGKVLENRLMRDLEINNILYAEIVKNKELAKFNLEQERPVFQLIDDPMLPLEIIKKSMVIFSVLGGFAFLLLGSFIVSFVFIYKNRNFLLDSINN